MTSFIVASIEKNKSAIYINDFLKKEQIDEFDVTRFTKERSKNQDSIGIEDVKDLQVTIFLKPIKSVKKAIIIEDADALTIEAQNSLLKVLEEPPIHTILILCTVNIEKLLPTILSRCQIVTLPAAQTSITKEEKIEIEDIVDNLSGMKVGDRLKIAEMLSKDKDNTVEKIGKIIILLREKLLGSFENPLYEINTLKMFQELYVLLENTNVNPRFAIENTFLSVRP